MKILIVEDDKLLCETLSKFFTEHNYEVFIAEDGYKAIDVVKRERPHLMFLDLNIPPINGLEVLRLTKEFDPSIKVIVVTALDDREVMAKADELGANAYVTKPVNVEYLKDCVMDKVSAQIYEELRASNERLMTILRGITRAFALAIDKIDHRYTYRHVERTVDYAIKISQILRSKGIKDDLPEDIFLAGVILHDVGKIFVPKEILYKRNKLDEREWEIMRRHPVDGAEVLAQIKGLEEVANIILHHHERYDGKGYPKGLKGEGIPLAARISSAVDAFESMITDRPYRKAMTIKEAIEELKRNRGTQFDPNVVDAFIQLFGEGGNVAKEQSYFDNRRG